MFLVGRAMSRGDHRVHIPADPAGFRVTHPAWCVTGGQQCPVEWRMRQAVKDGAVLPERGTWCVRVRDGRLAFTYRVSAR